MTKRRLFPFLLIYLAWLATWFWVFSFGFSSSFFKYHLATRLPVLILGLLCVAVPPLSGAWSLRRALDGELPAARAVLVNLMMCGAPLLLFWGVIATWVMLARQTGRLAFEADEALGNGIIFMMCLAVALAAVLIVPLILGALRWWQRRVQR